MRVYDEHAETMTELAADGTEHATTWPRGIGSPSAAYPVGYYGYDAWSWGIATTLAEILTDEVADEYAATMLTRDEPAPTEYAAEHVHELAATFRHVDEHRGGCDDTECTRCQWWHEDTDRALDVLNSLTPRGYLWNTREGGLYLSYVCENEDEHEQTCRRDDCARWEG
jgi:hypothetical protein